MKTEAILKKYTPEKENLIEILHEIQNNNPKNFLPEDDLKKVASFLNISLSSVFGVVEYYSMFSLKPRGKNVIRLCSSPVCYSQKSCDIRKEICSILNINEGEITSDEKFSLETVECLGHCEHAPAMMINKKVYKDLTKEKIKKIFQKIN